MSFHGPDALDGARWIHGVRNPRRATDPPLQVLRYDDQTFILRQSKAVHYEAPFIFLLVGEERALLLDTGATADPSLFPLRATVDGLIGDRELVVAHTHSHGDHVAGDGQFAGRPATTVVGHAPDEVRAFFGFPDWPDAVVEFDLGGRVLEAIGAPGHHAAAVAFYDRGRRSCSPATRSCPRGSTRTTTRPSWRRWTGSSRSPNGGRCGMCWGATWR